MIEGFTYDVSKVTSEWNGKSHYRYEYYPRIVVVYRTPENFDRKIYPAITAFVNLRFRPTPDAEYISEFIQKALTLGHIDGNMTNLRFNNHVGEDDAFWYADIED